MRKILFLAQLLASLEINIWRAALHRSINQSANQGQTKFLLQHIWLSLTEENMYCIFICHAGSWQPGVWLKADFFYSIDSKLQLLLSESETEGFSHPQQRQRCWSVHCQDAFSGRECDADRRNAPSLLLFPPWELSRGMFSADCRKARWEQLVM